MTTEILFSLLQATYISSLAYIQGGGGGLLKTF